MEILILKEDKRVGDKKVESNSILKRHMIVRSGRVG